MARVLAGAADPVGTLNPPPLCEPADGSSGYFAAKAGPASAEKSAATRAVFEKNVVKTFRIFTSKSTFFTPNCGTWISRQQNDARANENMTLPLVAAG